MNRGLRIRGVSVGYGRQRVLEDLTLPDLRAGALVGLLGANGAGKSTLLKGIAGLADAAGEIRLDECDLGVSDLEAKAGLLGYLPQTLPNGSHLLAYEYVLHACRAHSRRGNPAAVQRTIEEVFSSLSLEALAFRSLEELSGGQRQLVGLAQLLVRGPDLLLLDEPTSALDLRWQVEVLIALRQVVRQARLALIALHDLNLALRFCDLVAVLADGKLIAVGEPVSTVTPEVLLAAYQIEARVEQCSAGYPVVIVDQTTSLSS